MDPYFKNLLVDSMMKDVDAQTDTEKAFFRTCIENTVGANFGGKESDGGFLKNLIIENMMEDTDAKTDAERAYFRTCYEKIFKNDFGSGDSENGFSNMNFDPFKQK